jgi:hypothetical protein
LTIIQLFCWLAVDDVPRCKALIPDSRFVSAYKQVPYRLINDSTGNVKIASAHAAKEFAPEEISALVLRKLTDDAAKFLGDKVSLFRHAALCCGSCVRLLCNIQQVAT